MSRCLYFFFALSAVALLTHLNVRAHCPGGLEVTMAQLRFLEDALAGGAAERMQQIFPEGYVFTWALYGLASAQVARQLRSDDPRRRDLLDQARRAVARVDSRLARSTFDADLDPAYGAFYTSWSLYLRAEYIRAVGPGDAPAGLLRTFQEDCTRFANAVRRSGSPFLPSYRDAAWPADTAVGIAALGIHDRTLLPTYGEVIGRWVTDSRARLDGELGGLSHAAATRTGAPQGGVRGSSLALMSRVLIDADPRFAAEQYAALRQHFIDYTWGVPGVREYAHGNPGKPDVDSGPILLGYGGPAVVVGAAAARVHGDESVARALLGAVEVGGLPMELRGRRRYAGGAVPVGDAFIAWSRSSAPLDGTEKVNWERLIPEWWALPAHLLSTVVAGVVLLPALRAFEARRERRKPNRSG